MRVNISPHPTRLGWYYLVYRPDGSKGKKQYDAIEGYDNAVAMQGQIEDRFNAPTRRKDTHPRIKDVYKEFLAWCEEHQARATYIGKRNAFNNIIIPHFGEYRVKQLDQAVYDDFQKKLAGKRRAIILYQDYLGSLITWLVKRKMAPLLDFKPEKPKYHASKPVVPDMRDIQRVIDYVEDADKKVLLITMLWTGLRWNEARLLRWEDVYISQHMIRVRESDQEEEVHVAIYPEMMPWFKVNKKSSGWVFANPKTKSPWTSLKRILGSASKTLHVDVDHHDFRRRSGQNVYEASGYDVFAAQKHLRHKEIKTTMRYLGINEQRQAQIRKDVVEHVAHLRQDKKPRLRRVK